MIIEIVIGILLLAVVAGFTVYFLLLVKKKDDKYKELVILEDNNKTSLDFINSNNPKIIEVNSNLSVIYSDIDLYKKDLEKQIKDLSTSFKESVDYNTSLIDAYKSNISTSNLIVDGFSFGKDSVSGKLQISSDLPIIMNTMSTNILEARNAKIGDFSIYSSNNGLHINNATNATNATNLNNTNNLNNINEKAGIYFNSDITACNIYGGSVNINGGKLNFASVNSPMTIDISDMGDLRFIMKNGSNGISPDRAIDFVNENGIIAHKFDIQGNSTHNNMNLNANGCVNFGSNNGNICYKDGEGMYIRGGECNVVHINDNIDTKNLTTKVLGIGNLSITSSNGQLVVVDNSSKEVIGSIAYMNAI